MLPSWGWGPSPYFPKEEPFALFLGLVGVGAKHSGVAVSVLGLRFIVWGKSVYEFPKAGLSCFSAGSLSPMLHGSADPLCPGPLSAWLSCSRSLGLCSSTAMVTWCPSPSILTLAGRVWPMGPAVGQPYPKVFLIDGYIPYQIKAFWIRFLLNVFVFIFFNCTKALNQNLYWCLLLDFKLYRTPRAMQSWAAGAQFKKKIVEFHGRFLLALGGGVVPDYIIPC